MKKKMGLVCGVGINDSSYPVQINSKAPTAEGKYKLKMEWICPYYLRWRNILIRCYPKKQENSIAYKDCYVSPEWLTFSKFREWMINKDWENKHLDKDFLVVGNKVYSESTCIFLPSLVNQFIKDNEKIRGNSAIGAVWNSKGRVYEAWIRNPFTNSNLYMGRSADPLVCHHLWLDKKLEFAKRIAEDLTDRQIAEHLIDRYENYHTYFKVEGVN
jgi:hypothetical protein